MATKSMKDLLALKMQAAERAALSVKHGEPDATFMAREAGPDLLEALRDLVDFYGIPKMVTPLLLQPVLGRARAAIAKAEG